MNKSWQPVCATSALTTDTMRNFTVANHTLLLVNAGDEFFALNHLCTHDDVALSLGCIKEKTVRCSLHGAVFNLADGAVLAEPAEEPIQTWQTRVVDDTVEVLI